MQRTGSGLERLEAAVRRGGVDFDADLGAGRARGGVEPRAERHPVGGANEVMLGAVGRRPDPPLADAPRTRRRRRPTPRRARRTAAATASRRRARSPSVTIDGSPATAARSTSWSGRERLDRATSGRDPAAPGAMSAIACSAARNRGASISESNSRKATTSASLHPVEHGLGADVDVRPVGEFVRRPGDGDDRSVRPRLRAPRAAG